MKVLEIVRFCYGVTELVAPGVLSTVVGGEEPDSNARKVIRVLGARHTLQALLTIRPGRRRHVVGGVVDLLHALSAAVFAVSDPRWRRTAAFSSAVSVAFAVGELR